MNNNHAKPVENQLLEFAIEDIKDFFLELNDKLTIGTPEEKLTWANYFDAFGDQSPYTDLDQDGDRDLTDAAKYHWKKAVEDANAGHAALAAVFKRMAIEIDHIQGEIPLAGGPD
ncbi:hypothetical protein [Caulobacter sp. LjRoot300]|uniref:hypothetical protein n=1 Tax=Caulobacter sp. LjRoot300 TaxID=3342321 RepID=UPI003ECE1B82